MLSVLYGKKCAVFELFKHSTQKTSPSVIVTNIQLNMDTIVALERLR